MPILTFLAAVATLLLSPSARGDATDFCRQFIKDDAFSELANLGFADAISISPDGTFRLDKTKISEDTKRDVTIREPNPRKFVFTIRPLFKGQMNGGGYTPKRTYTVDLNAKMQLDRITSEADGTETEKPSLQESKFQRIDGRCYPVSLSDKINSSRNSQPIFHLLACAELDEFAGDLTAIREIDSEKIVRIAAILDRYGVRSYEYSAASGELLLLRRNGQLPSLAGFDWKANEQTIKHILSTVKNPSVLKEFLGPQMPKSQEFRNALVLRRALLLRQGCVDRTTVVRKAAEELREQRKAVTKNGAAPGSPGGDSKKKGT